MLAVLSGLVLYGRFAHATRGAWMRTLAGVGFSTGAVVALVGLGIGMGIGMRSMARMQRIGREAAAGGGSPTEAQAAEMQRL